MLAFTKDSAPPQFRTLLMGQRCKAQLFVKYVCSNDQPVSFWSSIRFQTYSYLSNSVRGRNEMYSMGPWTLSGKSAHSNVQVSSVASVSLGSYLWSFCPKRYVRGSWLSRSATASQLRRGVDSIVLVVPLGYSVVGLVHSISTDWNMDGKADLGRCYSHCLRYYRTHDQYVGD